MSSYLLADERNRRRRDKRGRREGNRDVDEKGRVRVCGKERGKRRRRRDGEEGSSVRGRGKGEG
jgi:hypothetical protein